ncbi:MAG: BatD family protein, partial [Planctomycetota bacterium]
MSIRVLIPRFTPLATVVLLLMSAPVAHAEITVRVASDEATLFVHEPFTLRLDVESDLPPEVPKVPEVPGLAVVAVRRLPSDPAARKHAFEITMIAERDGPATLPSFAVQSGDETARTAPLRIHIRAPRRATEMALAISVEPTALRVGQPAAVTVTWTSEVSLKRCRQLFFEIPLLADARCQVFPLDPPVPETEWVGLPVNGIRVFAQSKELPDHRQVLSFRCMLVPTEPCVLRLPPARLSCALVEDTPLSGQPPSYFYNEFFAAPGASDDYEQVYLAAPTSELVVRAITEPGRRGRFAGIVGPCDLKASIVPADLVVGQPGLLTVHLSDLTFARHITGLPLAAFDGLQPDFLVSNEAIRETVGEHTRSFTYVIRPLRSGITHLPAIVLQTFDPVAGEYRTLRSQTIPITVEPDEQGATRAAATRIDSEPPAPLSGIRQNRKDDRVILFVQDLLSFLGRHWWAFLPLPPLLWLALLPVARRWERCRRDPVYARATAALWRFRRTAWRDEETGLRNYLADRLALCAEALTAETVADALRTRSVDTELITEVRSRFDERDAIDYGKRPAAPARSTRSLVRRLQKATVPLLVVCGLWVPLGVH